MKKFCFVLAAIFVICTFSVSCQTGYKSVPKSLKILAVGNSFSVDAMEYLYNIAESAGVEDIVLGNLYIGGCSLERHFNNTKSLKAEYKYYKNSFGEWTTTDGCTIEDGIKDEDWDVITIQQSSKTSGLPESYGENLTGLIDYIEEEKTNPDAKLFWHMTWAYQQDSTHSAFVNYSNDQKTMYNMIVDTARNHVMTLDSIDGIIPNGTAIQNARTSFVGDTLTRDGYHLNKTLGRYIAGLCYFAAITGADISDIDYVPADDITKSVKKMAIDSVKDAVLSPYKVTKSSHTVGSW